MATHKYGAVYCDSGHGTTEDYVCNRSHAPVRQGKHEGRFPNLPERAGNEHVGHEIVVDSSVSKDDVEVRDAAGNLVPLTESGRRFREHLETGGKLQNPQHIKAGGHIGESFPDPRQLYDMSRPGEYSIQVSLYDDGTKIWVKSDTITVTVTP